MTWSEYAIPRVVRVVVRETYRDLAEVTNQAPGTWNVGGFANRLAHHLVVDGDEVSVYVAGRTAHALARGYYPERYPDRPNVWPPGWLNAHLVGDLLWHRIVAGASRDEVLKRIERAYATPAVPALTMPDGYRGDILTLGMRSTDRKAPHASFNWHKLTRAERNTDRALMRQRGYNTIMFCCYDEEDGRGWNARYRGGYNLIETPDRVVELMKENAGAGFHSFLAIKSDDCPQMDGHRTDPWKGFPYFRKHLPAFLDVVRPHMTLPAITWGTEINEWMTAEDHGKAMQFISDRHPDLWIGQWYTAGRDNHGSRTGSSYGPESFTWKGKTIDWAGPWWQMSQARCHDKAFMLFQASKQGSGESDGGYKRAFRDQIRTLMARARGAKWGVKFPLWLWEVDWDRGEDWARQLAAIAAEEGVTSFGQGAPV